jgi:hypothetical protein
MKHLKKIEEQEKEQVEQPVNEPVNLYEADMDDLDSSDIGDSHKSYLKKKKSSKYDPGI